MLLIIEHSGTPEHNKIAEFIANFAEDEMGFTPQPIIGSDTGGITLYTEDLVKIAEFEEAPDETRLYFYLSEMEDDET